MEEMGIAVNAVTSDSVKIWMNWMMLIFILSLLFIYKHVSARYIFGAFVLTIPLALWIFNLTKSPHLIGIAHIIAWLPLAIYLIRVEIIGKTEKLKSIYGVYLTLIIATIFISLFFDIRDSILIGLGMKDPYL